MSAGFLTVHMKNSKDPAQPFNHKTSKKDIPNHGFGLSIIEDICEKFNANEKWLRTGEGEMFIRKTRSETIADFMVDMLNEEEPSYKRRLIEALAELSTDEWKLLENITLKLAEKKD